MKKTRAALEHSSTESPLVIVGSSSSSSPLSERYRSSEFRLASDNALAYRVAANVVRLRRYRRLSQAYLAKEMGTSQPKIARIEGGDENITLKTLVKLVKALKGRIQLSISPQEKQLPRLPDWWTDDADDFSSETPWAVWGVCAAEDAKERRLGVAWVSTNAKTAALTGVPEPVLLTGGDVA